MINTRELRVENLVLSPVGWIGKVYNVSPQFVTLIDDNLAPYVFGQDLIDPIPITPEWLERLGFEKGGKDGNDFYFGDFRFFAEDNDWNDLYLNTYFNGRYIGVNPRHVHTMQNLVFALSETELTIKQ